jgi:hypothetical protein
VMILDTREAAAAEGRLMARSTVVFLEGLA